CATAAGWSTFATARRAAVTPKITTRSGAAIQTRRCAAEAIPEANPGTAPHAAACRGSPATTWTRSSTAAATPGATRKGSGKAKFRWTEQISEADLTARVAAEYPEVGRVRQLVAKRRGVSGRIGVLAIEGDKPPSRFPAICTFAGYSAVSNRRYSRSSGWAM